MNYDNGLNQIKNFFDYILTFAKEYKAASHVTVGKLGVFLENIMEDKANFELDYNWLNTTAVTMSKKELEQLTFDIEKSQTAIGISDDTMKKLREEINSACEEIKGWSTTSATISGDFYILLLLLKLSFSHTGIQGASQLTYSTSNLLAKYKLNSYNKYNMKAFNYPKFATNKIENYQAKYDKASKWNSKSWIKNKTFGKFKEYQMKKYDTKLATWGEKLGKAHSYGDRAKIKKIKKGKCYTKI